MDNDLLILNNIDKTQIDQIKKAACISIDGCVFIRKDIAVGWTNKFISDRGGLATESKHSDKAVISNNVKK